MRVGKQARGVMPNGTAPLAPKGVGRLRNGDGSSCGAKRRGGAEWERRCPLGYKGHFRGFFLHGGVVGLGIIDNTHEPWAS